MFASDGFSAYFWAWRGRSGSGSVRYAVQCSKRCSRQGVDMPKENSLLMLTVTFSFSRGRRILCGSQYVAVMGGNDRELHFTKQ